MVTVGCNLTLVPCLLLVFPRYFTHANCNCCLPACMVRPGQTAPVPSAVP